MMVLKVGLCLSIAFANCDVLWVWFGCLGISLSGAFGLVAWCLLAW